MASDGIDQEELGKFEVALLQEFAKRGFEMNLTGDNVTYQSQKTKQSGSADMAALFRTYKGGAPIQQIVDGIIGASGSGPATAARQSNPPPAPQANSAQAPPARESAPQPQQPPKVDLGRVYPLIRGPEFLAAFKAYMEKQAGGPLAPDHPSMPKVFLFSKDHQVYILCGLDLGGQFAYLDNKAVMDSGADEMGFFKAMMQNLVRKMDAIINGGQFKFDKQAEGAYILGLPEGLAPSFLLVGNRYYDQIAKLTNMLDARFFWAFSISGDEVMLGCPTLTDEGLKQAVTSIYQKQMELAKNPQANLVVRVEPMIILREGMTFPAPRQPSPTR